MLQPRGTKLRITDVKELFHAVRVTHHDLTVI
jgi:hypothetical protein